jgi:hypothetical protein
MDSSRAILVFSPVGQERGQSGVGAVFIGDWGGKDERARGKWRGHGEMTPHRYAPF